jgi:hypothetical protein
VVSFFVLPFQSLSASFTPILNNEENLYNEFDVLSANRNISWNDFLMMPVKVKRYIIGRVQQQYETIQESINKNNHK